MPGLVVKEEDNSADNFMQYEMPRSGNDILGCDSLEMTMLLCPPAFPMLLAGRHPLTGSAWAEIELLYGKRKRSPFLRSP